MPNAPTRRSRVQLSVSSPTEIPDEAARISRLPWIITAAGWSAGAAILGLCAVALPVVAAWLTELRLAAPEVLNVTVSLWAAAHGVDVVVGQIALGVTPLGVTLALGAACGAAAHHVAVQVRKTERRAQRSPGRWWIAVVASCAASYVGACLALFMIFLPQGDAGALVAGATVVGTTGAMAGAGWGFGLDVLRGQPRWVRRLPGAVAVGVGVLVGGAAVALVISALAHWEQVAGLHAALEPDPTGSVLLVLAQLAYLPNLIVWAGSWALGAGISLGAGTVVSPGVTTVGFLPTVPIFGLLPQNGEAWSWVWVLLGTGAGVAVSLRLTRGSTASSTGWTWRAGLAGVLVGLVWSLFALFSGGDLGVDRLVGLGPRFPDVVWLSTAGIGLAAAATALTTSSLVQRRERPSVQVREALANHADAAAPASVSTMCEPEDAGSDR